jgi:hypothetical protein
MKRQILFLGQPALLFIVLCWGLGQALCFGAGPVTRSTQPMLIDYEEPRLLIGRIFAMGTEPKKLLFTSQRTATRSGSMVKVMCEYTYPDGSVAARDKIVYDGGQLVSFETDELQTNEKGSAAVRADPRNPAKRKVFFEYNRGRGNEAKKSTNTENLETETLVDDMIPAFIVSHWEALAKGTPARFRYIVLSRSETVGFKLVKHSEMTWNGTPALRLKMEPTSFIIAQLVDPIFFIVEKNGAHRILQYIGRTTPLIRDGNKWKDLDADTIFDWK